jgi:type I restriction enzyme S subunit
MMVGMPVPFSAAVIDATGGNVKIQRKDLLTEGRLPVIDQGQEDVAGFTNDFSHAYSGDLPVVLFGDHTRAFKYVDTPFALGADGVKVLAPRAGFNAKFLYYYFLSRDIPSRGYSRHFKFLKEFDIPLFPPSEQTRIVELLEEADRLRRLRRDANAKAARILPALFLKMFGDPATNPMGWPEKPLSKVIQSVEAGWSAPSEGRPREGNQHGVLKVSAVTSGVFQPKENKAVADVSSARSLIIPKRGDLLFSRANTRELVAASCVVESDCRNLFLPDKLWRLVPFTGEASGMFLKELFWQESIRDKFRAASSGSSGSMLNISQDAMLRTIVPIPPFHLQERFESLAWDVMDALNHAKVAAEGIDSIWSNLLQRAFSGQLTAQWRAAHMQELLAEMAQQACALNLPIPKELEALS